MAAAPDQELTRDTLLEPGSTCWRVARAERVAFLVDGESFFPTLAAALERAQHQVLLLGWDFHGRVLLRRDGRRRRLPDEFQNLLAALLERRPELRVHALGWGYGVLRAVARELLPALHLGLRTPPRLDFRLDTAHPVLGCHHQKVIVIDDAVAFVGGFDVTDGRWDSRAHRALDSRRIAPDGRAYGPFHDVQMAVDGEAAAALGALARERYRRATGRRLEAPPAPGQDAWPQALAPSLCRVDVGIARTAPRYRGHAAVREVEELYLASIGAARRSIYAENQYLTSECAVDALAGRLREPEGPEIVVVGPQRCAFLEEISMGVLRTRAIERLRAADRHGRLRIYYPRIPGGGCVNVHSKLMVVDDQLVRIGSSNLSNRSLGLDTECDLAIEARGRADVASRIAALRDDLLAEHLGCSVTAFSAARARHGSLIAAIESLRGGPRTLEPVEPRAPRWAVALVSGSGVADPGLAQARAQGARLPLRAPGLVLALLAVVLAAVGLLPSL